MVTDRGVGATFVLAALLAVLVAMPAQPRRADASFPGANGLIAFTRYISQAGELNCEIFTVDPVNLETVNLTNSPECEIAPAWSPDGTRIAFHRNSAIWVMNADGSDPAPVVGANGFDPAWSPDGSMIAFHGGNLFVIDAAGGTPLTLAPSGGAGLDGGPSWSPDCTRIAFPSGNGLSLINPDGTGMELLASSESLSSNSPSWSPDSRYVAFSRFPGVVMVNVDTREETTLPGGDDMYAEVPAWSPNGTEIAFTSSVGTPETQNIYTANVDGSGLRQLTRHTQGEQWSDWQPLPDDRDLPDCEFSVPSPPASPTPPNVPGLPSGGGPPGSSRSNAAIGSIVIGFVAMLTGSIGIAASRTGRRR